MNDRIEMTVKMQVTHAQGLALQAMFKHWNLLAGWGSSRDISFYVDGDGNFHPDCKISFDGEIPELTEEIEESAIVSGKHTGDLKYDFDAIAWMLHT